MNYKPNDHFIRNLFVSLGFDAALTGINCKYLIETVRRNEGFLKVGKSKKCYGKSQIVVQVASLNFFDWAVSALYGNFSFDVLFRDFPLRKL